MALIRCPECGAQISDMATSCPHCGYPLQPFYAEPIDLTPKKEAAPVHTPETPTGYTMFDDSIGKPIDGRKRKKTGVILSIVLICIVAFGAWAVKLSKDNPDSDKGTNEKASQKAYEPTPTPISEDDYKALCEDFSDSSSWKSVMRYPSDYMLKNIKFTGQIIQVMNGDDNDVYLRVGTTKSGSEDIWLVYYKYGSTTSRRWIEDDYVMVYGICSGTSTYETIFGQSITIPSVIAKYLW